MLNRGIVNDIRGNARVLVGFVCVGLVGGWGGLFVFSSDSFLGFAYSFIV